MSGGRNDGRERRGEGGVWEWEEGGGVALQLNVRSGDGPPPGRGEPRAGYLSPKLPDRSNTGPSAVVLLLFVSPSSRS